MITIKNLELTIKNKTMIKPQELRLGNLVLDCSKATLLRPSQLNNILSGYLDYESIEITPETIEKHIDWQFEVGFNKSIVEKEYWIETHYLLENIIDGSSDFEIVFCENKDDKDLDDIYYFVDDNLLEFALEDNFHNLQNLFYIVSGQELPIKI